VSSKPDSLAVKHSLIADAAEAERRNGLMPDTRAADSLFTGVLQTAAKVRAERKPSASHERKHVSDVMRDLSAEARRQLQEDHGVSILSPVQLKQLNANRAATLAKKRALPERDKAEIFMMRRRLRLLSMFPDWRAKVIEAVNEGHRRSIVDVNHRSIVYHQGIALIELCEESCELFGDWRKTRARVLTGLPSGTVASKAAT